MSKKKGLKKSGGFKQFVIKAMLCFGAAAAVHDGLNYASLEGSGEGLFQEYVTGEVINTVDHTDKWFGRANLCVLEEENGGIYVYRVGPRQEGFYGERVRVMIDDGYWFTQSFPPVYYFKVGDRAEDSYGNEVAPYADESQMRKLGLEPDDLEMLLNSRLFRDKGHISVPRAYTIQVLEREDYEDSYP